MCENDVTACSNTRYLVIAEKNEEGILIILYNRDKKESPFAVIDCQPHDFKVWYPETGDVSRGSVFGTEDGYSDMLQNISCYYSSMTDTFANVTFVSREDKKIIEDFLSVYPPADHQNVSSKQVNKLPGIWRHFVWYQIHALDLRRTKRHFKKEQRKVQLFSYLNDPASEFTTWVWDKVMEDTQFNFYKPVTNTKVEIKCSVCGCDKVWKKSEINNFGRAHLGKCPECGANVKFTPASVAATWKIHNKRVSLIENTPEGFVYRSFEVYRSYGKDSLPSHNDRMEEVTRWFISKTGEETAYMYVGEKWLLKTDGWYYSDYLYPENIKSVIEDTKYRNSGLAEFAQSCIKARHACYFDESVKAPVLEKVAKAGFHAVIADYLMPAYWTENTSLNAHANDLYEALNLPRSEVRRIERLGLKNQSHAIYLLRKALANGVVLRDFEIFELLKLDIPYEEKTVFAIMQQTGLTAHKVIKYILDQKKHFPANSRYESIKQTLIAFDDYLKMSYYLKYDLRDRGYVIKPDLRKAHDATVEEYNTKKDQIQREIREREEREMAKQMEIIRQQANKNHSDAMHLRTDEFVLVGLWTPDELYSEGRALHNCIGSYANKVAEGKTMIFAIRKSEEPDIPYFALEYSNNRIIQLRGDHNCSAPQNVKAFANVFSEMMKKQQKVAA